MAPTVQELIKILQQIAPESLAEEWDNVGLLVGRPDQRVHRALLALDPTPTLIAQAASLGCDVILTHHPAIFRPLSSIRTDHPIGQFIALALQSEIAVIGCHTNLDAAIGGVSDVLAEQLGLSDTLPLVASSAEGGCGLGRIGTYPVPLPAEAFVTRLIQAIAPPWLLEAGPRPPQVTTAAVCGGSCGDFAELARSAGADVFVTAEIKHSVARWAEDAGFWIIDGGHFATENPAMTIFKERLEEAISAAGITIAVTAAHQETPLRLTPESLPAAARSGRTEPSAGRDV